jgi:hypothetical protein
MVGGSDLAFHVFDLDATSYQWPRFHYDPYNSGCYESGFYAVREHATLTTPHASRFRVLPSVFSDHCMIYWAGDDRQEGGKVTWTVYDLAGRLVYTAEDVHMDHLSPSLWSGNDARGRSVPCGVYFVRLQHKEHTSIHKVIKVK